MHFGVSGLRIVCSKTGMGGTCTVIVDLHRYVPVH